MWRRVRSDALYEWEWLGVSGGDTRLTIHSHASGQDWTHRYEVRLLRVTAGGATRRILLFSSDRMDDVVSVANWYMDEWERRHACITEFPERRN